MAILAAILENKLLSELKMQAMDSWSMNTQYSTLNLFLCHVCELRYGCCYDLAAILAAILKNAVLLTLKVRSMYSWPMST